MPNPTRSPKQILLELKDAAAKFNRPAVEALCGELISLRKTFPVKNVESALGVLRRKIFFDQMQRLAEAFLTIGKGSPKIRRQYGQSLIDEGLCIPALRILEEAISLNPPPSELKELKGLIGRAWKQLYVAAGKDASAAVREDLLGKSIDAYWAVYQGDPEDSRWHGINVVALLDRARRDKVPAPLPYSTGKTLAAEVLAQVGKLPAATIPVWDLAVAMESNVAFGKTKEALDWARKYVAHTDADAFELRSTLRQMEEIWQLTDKREPGKSLLSILRAYLTRQRGGSAEVPVDEVRSANKEPSALRRLFGKDSLPYEFYSKGLDRARAVAKITTKDGYGTGFLINARHFGPKFNDEVALMTCAHILDPGEESGAAVYFEASKHTCWIEACILHQDRYHGDLALWRLTKLPSDVPACEPEFRRPKLGAGVAIIGHPSEHEFSYSLTNTDVLFSDGRELHYRSPTRLGSAGSPVFSEDWKVVAIHQRGDATPDEASAYEANTAVSMNQAREIIMEMNSEERIRQLKKRA